MSRLLARLGVAALSLLMFVPTAFGWSLRGHQVIADIAFELLDAKTRQKAVALLKAHPRYRADFLPPEAALKVGAGDRWIFLVAAEWPDLVRGYPRAVREQFHHETWHYIGIPYFMTELDRQTLAKEVKLGSRDLPIKLGRDENPDDFNIVQAIKLCVVRLKDPKVDDDRKAVYLCWLMHLVGDLHQPLHAASLYTRGRFNEPGGDKGGNNIPTLKGNLHSFWDSLFGRAPLNGIGDLNEARKRTSEILGDNNLNQAGKKAATDLDPGHWADESHDLARSFVYSPQVLAAVKAVEGTDMKFKSIDLELAYREKAGAIAQRRAAEAGFRLARLIEASLQ